MCATSLFHNADVLVFRTEEYYKDPTMNYLTSHHRLTVMKKYAELLHNSDKIVMHV